MTWGEIGFNEAKSQTETHLGSGLRFTEPQSKKIGFRRHIKSIRKQLSLHPADTKCTVHHIHQCWGLSLSQRTADMGQTSLHSSDLSTVTPDAGLRYLSLSALCFLLSLLLELCFHSDFQWISTKQAEVNANKTIIIRMFWGESNKGSTKQHWTPQPSSGRMQACAALRQTLTSECSATCSQCEHVVQVQYSLGTVNCVMLTIFSMMASAH